jgi:signal transduction histidine kinase/ligand-binding sensor domain-containing protein
VLRRTAQRQGGVLILGPLIVVLLWAAACGSLSLPASPEPATAPTVAGIPGESDQAASLPWPPPPQGDGVKFEQISVEHGLSGRSVYSILQDSKGFMWFGTDDGLNKYDGYGFTVYRHDPADPNTPSGKVIVSLYEDQTGMLWIGTGDGAIDRFDRETAQFAHFAEDSTGRLSLEHDATIPIYFLDSSGVRWIGTYGQGLSRGKPGESRVTAYMHDPNDPHSLSSDYVLSIYQDRSGALWIGTLGGGVNKLDPAVQRFVRYQHDPHESDSLSNNQVLSIYQDREGLFWIGTEGGLDSFDREGGQWHHYPADLLDSHGLHIITIMSIYQDQAGALWLGGAGGLDKLDRETGQFTEYSLPQVKAIHEDEAGTFWIGTTRGLYTFDRGRGFLDQPLPPRGRPGGLADALVRFLHQDRSGTLWVGTDDGLYRLDRGSEQFTHYQHDPQDPRSLGSNTVTSIGEDQSGGLWLGTVNGLDQFDRASETFVHYREQDGLPDDVVVGILEDEGVLWLSTQNGLSRFDPRTETFTNYDAGDGLQGNEFTAGAYYKSDDGEMFFGGTQGLTSFYPQLVGDNPHRPPIALTALTQGGEDVALGQALESVTEVTFKWPKNFFEFDFAALSYTQPAQNQYAYLLEGFDQDWNYIGTKRFGRYTNLPGGTYTLRLKGSNNDGVWNEEGTSIKVTLVPPFWQTAWFWGLVALVLVGGAIGGYRLRVRGIEARSHELERQVEQRTSELSAANVRLEQEIAERQRAEAALAQQAAETAVAAERSRLARELHDSVTQSLYSATLLAEAGQRLSKSGDQGRVEGYLARLGEISQQALREMRLLVYELRPLDLEEGGLVGALQQRLDAVERRAGVRARLVVDGEVELPAGVEEQLYRIAQEALNNALKHGAPTLVVVTIRLEGQGTGSLQRIEMEITDDGRGFDPEAAGGEGGIGLISMRERAEKLGGTLTVHSAPGEGTRVRVVVSG